MQKATNDIVVFLIVTTFLLLMMGSFIFFIVLLHRKKQIVHQRELEQIKAEYEKTLLKTQLEIQEQTFQAISRDIHDNINLALTLAKLNLNTLDLSDNEKSVDKIKTSIDFVSNAIVELTNLSRSMNSEIIADQGLITALQQETAKLEKLNRFRVHFEVMGSTVYMDSQKELFIFRIVQEAFNNILKHAEAKAIRLSLSYGNDCLSITVVDDGIGFVNEITDLKMANRPTAGLRNMRKRAELLNGSCTIESNIGSGTIVKILIPF